MKPKGTFTPQMAECDHDHDDLQSVLDEERALMNFYAPDYQSSFLFNNQYYAEERRLFVDWLLQAVRDAGGGPEGWSCRCSSTR